MQAVIENNSVSTPVRNGIVVDSMVQPASAGSESIDTETSPVICCVSTTGPVTPAPELLTRRKGQQSERKAPGEASTQNADANGNLVQLEEKIKSLWSAHQLGEDKLCADQELLSVHKTKCKAVRLALEESLFTYKGRLVGKGRDGQWSKFLRDAKISKTTADRYVARWAKRLKPEKLVSDELLKNDQITQLALPIAKRLSGQLKTRAAVGVFLKAIEGYLFAFVKPEAEEPVAVN